MKMTNKQLGGYHQAKKEWISQNDCYNIAKFGIDLATYNKIHRAEIDAIGICGGSATLKQINNCIG